MRPNTDKTGLQWLPRRAMAVQLAAQSAAESECECSWEPPGLILETPGLLLRRIYHQFWATISSHSIPRTPFRFMPFHAMPFHSIPLDSIPFHSIPFHSIPLHWILCAPFQSMLFPINSAPFHSTPFHCIPFHCMPLHSMPLFSNPLLLHFALFRVSGFLEFRNQMRTKFLNVSANCNPPSTAQCITALAGGLSYFPH